MIWRSFIMKKVNKDIHYKIFHLFFYYINFKWSETQYKLICNELIIGQNKMMSLSDNNTFSIPLIFLNKKSSLIITWYVCWVKWGAEVCVAFSLWMEQSGGQGSVSKVICACVCVCLVYSFPHKIKIHAITGLKPCSLKG